MDHLQSLGILWDQLLIYSAIHTSSLEGATFWGLLQPPILVRTHLIAQTQQVLFYSHVSVPSPHGRQAAVQNRSSFWIDARHINPGHEMDDGGHGRVFIRAVDAELIESTIVMWLIRMERGNRRTRRGARCREWAAVTLRNDLLAWLADKHISWDGISQ